MSALAFTLPPSRGVAISQATADLIIAGDAVSAFAMGSLRFKCAVVQSVVDTGKAAGELTVDELVTIIRRESPR
ncbi:hypothetical protein [Pseudoxanthomonas mexicana]|uniref:hypothetical protein n=1 Tax=Pseudoxanthomonas mexicana TaxID=128785 RepID=UPI00398B1B25